MATHAVLGEERSLSIGRVLNRAFGTLGANPVATFGIAFLFGAVPQTLYTYFIGSALTQARQISSIAASTASVALSIGAFVLFLILSMLVQGALVRATMDHADGRRASIADCIRTGLSRAAPLIGLTLLLILGIMGGFVLFFVPGVILYLMWSVAVPALVAEEGGIFAAFSRSRFLTKGVRWRIFGLQMVLLVIAWLLSLALSAIILASGIGIGNATSLSLPYLLLSSVTSMATIAVWSTAQASLYIDLCAWKDGPQSHDLVDIFA